MGGRHLEGFSCTTSWWPSAFAWRIEAPAVKASPFYGSREVLELDKLTRCHSC
jgi:hypothetical protein